MPAGPAAPSVSAGSHAAPAPPAARWVQGKQVRPIRWVWHANVYAQKSACVCPRLSNYGPRSPGPHADDPTQQPAHLKLHALIARLLQDGHACLHPRAAPKLQQRCLRLRAGRWILQNGQAWSGVLLLAVTSRRRRRQRRRRRRRLARCVGCCIRSRRYSVQIAVDLQAGRHRPAQSARRLRPSLGRPFTPLLPVVIVLAYPMSRWRRRRRCRPSAWSERRGSRLKSMKTSCYLHLRP